MGKRVRLRRKTNAGETKAELGAAQNTRIETETHNTFIFLLTPWVGFDND